jgi:hypothetical protein
MGPFTTVETTAGRCKEEHFGHRTKKTATTPAKTQHRTIAVIDS